MKRMQLSKKLKTNSGMSLAETLFAVLLISFIFTAVTAGIGVIQRIYYRVVLRADAITVLATVNSVIDADLATATEISDSDSTDSYVDNITFRSGRRNILMGYSNSDGDDNTGMIWAYSKTAKNVDTGEKGVYVPLITEAAKTDKLTLELNEIEYNASGKYFTYTVTVTDIKGNEITKTFAVKNETSS